jgi:hypothetical protein
MTEAEAQALHLLKQIDQKVERTLRILSDGAQTPSGTTPMSRSESAKEIAAMTPSSIRQTDAVELLHEDRSR